MADLSGTEKSDDGGCNYCGGELKRFEHRPDSGVRQKDQKLCKINKLPTADHLCIVECTMATWICTSCRLVQGSETAEHHPERSR